MRCFSLQKAVGFIRYRTDNNGSVSYTHRAPACPPMVGEIRVCEVEQAQLAARLAVITNMSSPNLALDLMLKTFLTSPEFSSISDKGWSAISKTLPGTTPRQCQRRYEELLKEVSSSSSLSLSHSTNATAILGQKTGRSEAYVTENKSSQPTEATKSKSEKLGKENSDSKLTETGSPDDQGPLMVIHVCDEAKNLKQDFHCPRDLLVREMKYFAEYLSTDAQRWEEVDISVHCDVQIFDWLMKYVKRSCTKDGLIPPKLEATTVISILISSDFLKMDNLVNECISFCHKNMAAIVATPCNMNCINDKLVSRIAELFNHNEADDVRDRKDKFKSKLFMKLLERLFDPTTLNSCSPENAASLFRCSVCKKILTSSLECQVKCLQSRMTVNRQGNLSYSHQKDPAFDVHEYLLELKLQLKTWRDVYWRMWGIINYLSCSRCGETFVCNELGHCRYHPEQPQFPNNKEMAGVMGEYSCCNLKVLRFDPTQNNKGCKVRDHIVNLPSQEDPEPHSRDKQRVYQDLLSHRDAVCLPYDQVVPLTNLDGEVDVFGLEDQSAGRDPSSAHSSSSNIAADDTSTKNEGRPAPRLQALTIEREVTYEEDVGFGESDDEVGDEEEVKVRKPRSKRSRVTVDPQAILLDAPDFSTTKTRKWDSSRSLRWNQDAQREEDQRRMYEIVNYLTRLRINSDKIDRLRQKEYAGGIFSRLDAQWKAANTPAPKTLSTQIRNKPRLSQLVTK